MKKKLRRDSRSDSPSRASQAPQEDQPIPSSASQGAGPASDERALREGVITEGSRGRYRVQTSDGAYWCALRGRLRKEFSYATSSSARRGAQRVDVREGDPVAIGDHVWLLPVAPGEGVIERVAKREGAALARTDPDAGRARRPLTAVSGLDQIVMVFAAREPAPHLRLADRFIALAESQGAGVILCLNKADQGIEPWLAGRLRVYSGLGYTVIETSATTGPGVEPLRAALAGHVSAFAGPSGVGKSSLLNALEPDLALRIAEISGATGKGRHTTTAARLIPLDGPGGGWIADTAGIRALDPGKISDLPGTFREFRPYSHACAWPRCQHLGWPDCAVLAALRDGSIDPERYDSYHRLATGTPAPAAFFGPTVWLPAYGEEEWEA